MPLFIVVRVPSHVMYIYVGSCCHFSIGLWNCSDSVVFLFSFYDNPYSTTSGKENCLLFWM